MERGWMKMDKPSKFIVNNVFEKEKEEYTKEELTEIISKKMETIINAEINLNT